jgi:uncharacterized protein with ATP-grasp and redox domains
MDTSLNVHLDCFPCFLKQVVISLNQVALDASSRTRILKETLHVIQNADTSSTPAHVTTLIHRKVRQLLGCDPFREVKATYNRRALALYPQLTRLVRESSDPLWSASRLAIAGNAIDFGITDDVDMEASIDHSFCGEPHQGNFSHFRHAVMQQDDILYLLDNAGEIVLDKLLIELLVDMGKRVTAVVKGSPVINDATEKDALSIGLDEICDIRDNGSDGVGTILEMCHANFRDLFFQMPLIISKGQANFETLMTVDRDIFFLFQSKCNVVSDFLKVQKGTWLLLGQGELHSLRKTRHSETPHMLGGGEHGISDSYEIQ